MPKTDVFAMKVSKVYPMYIDKVVKKGQDPAGVDTLISWLTGYDQKTIHKRIEEEDVDFRTFFTEAPNINPNADKITGWICGHRVQDMEPGLMKQLRWLDKIIDELSKGKALDKIMRS